MSKQTADFRLVIEKNGIDQSKLSKTIKGYISDYVSIETGIQDLQDAKEKNDGNLSEEDERELQDFTEALEEKDKDLVKRINSWIANAAVNAERGAALSTAKAKKAQEKINIAAGLNADGSKKADGPNPPTPAPAPAPSPAPIPPGPNPAPVKKAGEEELPYTPAEEVEEEKKSTGFWGWLAAAVIVGIGIAVGVKLKGKN